MSDEDKTKRCLRLIVLRLFDLELRLLAMRALLSPDQREGLEAGYQDEVDEKGEQAQA